MPGTISLLLAAEGLSRAVAVHRVKKSRVPKPTYKDQNPKQYILGRNGHDPPSRSRRQRLPLSEPDRNMGLSLGSCVRI
ncbi:hypothetical protein GGR56DRAFT_645796 [Xylariaceae sp. FL0804]|nr:hypothetical protein GGR56DRAFT_645796 [Xylariaceae sp. FL0804]